MSQVFKTDAEIDYWEIRQPYRKGDFKIKNKFENVAIKYEDGVVKFLNKRQVKINYNKFITSFKIINLPINITKIKCWLCQEKRSIENFPNKDFIDKYLSYSIGYDSYYEDPQNIGLDSCICCFCKEELKSFSGIKEWVKLIYLYKDENLKTMFKEIIRLKELKDSNKINFRKAKRKK